MQMKTLKFTSVVLSSASVEKPPRPLFSRLRCPAGPAYLIRERYCVVADHADVPSDH